MDTELGITRALAWYGDTFLGSAPLLFAGLGLLLWALAGATLGLHRRIRRTGYRTAATVLGTVLRPRVTAHLGGAPREDHATHLAVEYRDALGAPQRGLLSEWEDAYARFAQGQALTLWVVPSPSYDDLYLASGRGAPKLALGFMVAGSLCLFRLWLSPWAWLGGVAVAVLAFVASDLFLGRVQAPASVPPNATFVDSELRPMGRQPPG